MKKISVLNQDVLQKISGLISKALNDDEIFDEEFSLIVSELDTFQSFKKQKQNCVQRNKNESLLQKIALKTSESGVKSYV